MNLHDNMNEMRRLGVGPDRLWRFVRERNLKEHNKRVAVCNLRRQPTTVTRTYGIKGDVPKYIVPKIDGTVEGLDYKKVWAALDETADANADAARKIESLERSLRIQSDLIQQVREERNAAIKESADCKKKWHEAEEVLSEKIRANTRALEVIQGSSAEIRALKNDVELQRGTINALNSRLTITKGQLYEARKKLAEKAKARTVRRDGIRECADALRDAGVSVRVQS